MSELHVPVWSCCRLRTAYFDFTNFGMLPVEANILVSLLVRVCQVLMVRQLLARLYATIVS